MPNSLDENRSLDGTPSEGKKPDGTSLQPLAPQNSFQPSAQQLQSSELHYKRLFEASRDAIMILEANTGCIIEANPRAQELLGRSLLELIGQELWRVGVHRDRQITAAFLDTVKENGDVCDEDLLIQSQSGEALHVEFGSTLYSQDGQDFIQCNLREISKRRWANERLRQSEANLAKAQQIARMGSWELDLTRRDNPNLNTLHWSEEVFRIFGRTPGEFEVSRDNFLRAVHPEDRDLVKAAVAEAIRTHQFYDVEHRILLPDGSERFVHERAEIAFDPDSGQPVKLVGTVQDITESKQNELRLHRSNALLRAVTEGTSDAVFAKDADGRYLMMNLAGARLLGRGIEEVLGKTDAELLPVQTAQTFRENDRRTMEDGVVQTHEEIVVVGDVTRTYLATKGPLFGPDGEVIGIVGISRDISERQRAEAEILFQKILLEAQAETSLDGIVLVSEKGIVLSHNQRFVQMWGITQPIIDQKSGEQIIQEVLSQLDNPEEFLIRVKTLYLEREPRGQEEILLKDGRIFEHYSAPINSANDSYYGRVWYFRDISERKRAEEALRRSEARFRTLVQSSWDVFYLVEPNGLITYKSPAVTRVLGYEPEDMVGHYTTEFVHPDDAEGLRQERESLLATPNGFLSTVLRVRHKNGAWRWIECFEVNLVDHPDIRAIAVNYRDITERREAESQRDRFFTISQDMLAIVGADGHIKRANPAFIETMGFTEAELMTQPFRNLVHPDDRPATQAAIENLWRGVSLTDLVNRYPAKDGSWRWLEWRAVPALDEGVVYAAARDITERKEVEEELRRMRDELEVRVQMRTAELEKANAETRNRARQQEAVAQLGQRALADSEMENLLADATSLVTSTLDVEVSSLLELMPRGETLRIRAATGWSIDTSDHTIYADINSQAGYALVHEAPVIVTDLAAETRFVPSSLLLKQGIVSGITVVVPGYESPFGTLGAHTTQAREFTQEDIHFLQAMANVLAAAVERHHIDTEIRQLNAQLELTNENLHIENSERNAALAALSEVTLGLEQAKEEAEQARETAEKANAAKSEFLSRMSHELRTPLNAILGFAQIMDMRSSGTASKHQESIQQILKAGRHLLALINEVLDIARIEAGRLALSPEPVAIGWVVREVLGVMAPLAEARQIHLINEVESGVKSPQVLADVQRLNQVLLNFLSNAVKYNRSGGQVVVWCQTIPDQPMAYEGIRCVGRLRVMVGDTGLGLTPEEMGRLFVPFERLEANRTHIEGTGIGLSLCKRLVEAMNGQVGVDSEVGQGSTFWLELPLIQDSLQPEGMGYPPDGASPSPHSSNCVAELCGEGLAA